MLNLLSVKSTRDVVSYTVTSVWKRSIFSSKEASLGEEYPKFWKEFFHIGSSTEASRNTNVSFPARAGHRLMAPVPTDQGQAWGMSFAF